MRFKIELGEEKGHQTGSEFNQLCGPLISKCNQKEVTRGVWWFNESVLVTSKEYVRGEPDDSRKPTGLDLWRRTGCEIKSQPDCKCRRNHLKN